MKKINGALLLQVWYVRDNKNAFNGGYFAGTSNNKYYRKKQHLKFIEKLKLDNFKCNFLEFNLN